MCFFFRMKQSAFPEVDPTLICKLDGVELAVFPDDPHGRHVRVVFYDLTALHEQAQAGSQCVGSITLGLHAARKLSVRKTSMLPHAPPAVIAGALMREFYRKRLCGA